MVFGGMLAFNGAWGLPKRAVQWAEPVSYDTTQAFATPETSASAAGQPMHRVIASAVSFTRSDKRAPLSDVICEVVPATLTAAAIRPSLSKIGQPTHRNPISPSSSSTA